MYQHAAAYQEAAVAARSLAPSHAPGTPGCQLHTCQEMDKAIDSLNESIKLLSDRLTPVLRPEPSCGPPQALAAVVAESEIRRQLSRVVAAERVVLALVDRVEA